MKKQMIFLLTGTFVFAAAFSQDIEAVKKQMYYERWNGAEQVLNQMIRADSSNLDNYYWLTEVLIEDNALEKAKAVDKQVQDYVAAHPAGKDDLLYRVAHAEIMLQAGDSLGAAQIFDDLLKQTKEKNPQVLLAIANAWMHTKSPDYNEVLNVLDRAQKRDKNDPEIFSLRGDVYRRLNDGGKAVQSYQEALQKNPAFAEASYKIGKIYLTQNNPEMFLKFFTEAVAIDNAYAPAYYELYYYYYFRDVNKAKEYLDKYIANTDASVENDYMLADLYFASSKSKDAIEKAKSIIDRERDKAKPRLYKLIAYSYDALGDSVNALDYLQKYFSNEADTNYVARDFQLKAKLLDKFPGHEAEVIENLELAVQKDSVQQNKAEYATRLAALYKEAGDKKNEAKWLGQLYEWKDNPTNLDLYYWGIAHYSAGEYPQADSVFATYTEKYPEHIQGYYWRAKSNALIDSTMEQGLALPFYAKVIEMGSTDSIKNKSLLIQSYGYIGAYQANVKKDFPIALENFQKILQLDPANTDAIKYRDILKKWINASADNSRSAADAH